MSLTPTQVAAIQRQEQQRVGRGAAFFGWTRARLPLPGVEGPPTAAWCRRMERRWAAAQDEWITLIIAGAS